MTSDTTKTKGDRQRDRRPGFISEVVHFPDLWTKPSGEKRGRKKREEDGDDASCHPL